MTRDGIEQRVSLYADDLLLYVSRSDISIPVVLSIFNSFGPVSGYKLNFNKNRLFPLNAAAHRYFNFYYWAANFRILQYWLHADGLHDAPPWLRL